MKTKGNNSDVAHYWANQVQDELSNANGSFYYDGCTIYSYGKHFPIATILNNCVLFTTGSYSVPTGKHINEAMGAIYGHDKKIFRVPDVEVLSVWNIDSLDKNILHKNNTDSYYKRYDEEVRSAARSRKYTDHYLGRAVNLANELKDYVDVFDLDAAPIDTSLIDLEAVKENIKAERKKTARINKEKKAQLLIDQQENIKKWRNGERVYGSMYGLPCMLRINKDNDTIETSQGANIPLSFAPKLWRYISLCKAKQTPFTDSFRVGHYTLNGINKNGDIKVGCHDIKYNELLAIAKQLKLIS